jgi:hypothetical protein
MFFVAPDCDRNHDLRGHDASSELRSFHVTARLPRVPTKGIESVVHELPRIATGIAGRASAGARRVRYIPAVALVPARDPPLGRARAAIRRALPRLYRRVGADRRLNARVRQLDEPFVVYPSGRRPARKISSICYFFNSPNGVNPHNGQSRAAESRLPASGNPTTRQTFTDKKLTKKKMKPASEERLDARRRHGGSRVHRIPPRR